MLFNSNIKGKNVKKKPNNVKTEISLNKIFSHLEKKETSKNENENLLKQKTNRNNQTNELTPEEKITKNKFNPFVNNNSTLFDHHQNKTTPDKYSVDLEYINKNKTNNFEKEVKCTKCKRPFKRDVNDNWKKKCIYCFLKEKGILVNCSECPKKLYIFPNQIGTKYLCQVCYVIEHGIKNNCGNLLCKKVYFRMPDNSDLISYCEDCFLRRSGQKMKCKDCKIEYFVYKIQKSWRNRCHECWIKW